MSCRLPTKRGRRPTRERQVGRNRRNSEQEQCNSEGNDVDNCEIGEHGESLIANPVTAQYRSMWPLGHNTANNCQSSRHCRTSKPLIVVLWLNLLAKGSFQHARADENFIDENQIVDF